jgi:uncharacterized membrane protein
MLTAAFSANTFLNVLFTLINYAVTFYISIMLIKVAFRAIDDRDSEFHQIKPKLQDFLRYWIVNLFQIVIFLVTLMITMGVLGIFGLIKPGLMELYKNILSNSANLGSYKPAEILYGIALFFLFALPSIIISLRIQFSVYIVIDKQLEAVPAIMKSFKITKGNLSTIIGVLFGLILLNIMGTLLLLVGLLFTVPMSMIVLINLYKSLDEYYHTRGE